MLSSLKHLLNLNVPVFKMYICREPSIKKNQSLEFTPGYKINRDLILESQMALIRNVNTDWIFDDFKAF